MRLIYPIIKLEEFRDKIVNIIMSYLFQENSALGGKDD
jgi:hypothetical protein